MALVIEKRKFQNYGHADEGGTRLIVMFVDIDFDSSYPTGGEALDLSNDVKTIHSVIFEPKSGYVFEYDYTNKKVIAYYADYDAAADGALIQVADTTDLSAVTAVKGVVHGY